MRIPPGKGVGQSDHIQRVQHPRSRVGHPVQRKRAFDDLANALAGVQRRHRVLKDHLKPAPQGPQLRRSALRDIGAVKPDHPRGWLGQSHQRPPKGGFARSRSTDDAQHLAFGDVKTQPFQDFNAGGSTQQRFPRQIGQRKPQIFDAVERGHVATA